MLWESCIEEVELVLPHKCGHVCVRVDGETDDVFKLDRRVLSLQNHQHAENIAGLSRTHFTGNLFHDGFKFGLSSSEVLWHLASHTLLNILQPVDSCLQLRRHILRQIHVCLGQVFVINVDKDLLELLIDRCQQEARELLEQLALRLILEICIYQKEHSLYLVRTEDDVYHLVQFHSCLLFFQLCFHVFLPLLPSFLSCFLLYFLWFGFY